MGARAVCINFGSQHHYATVNKNNFGGIILIRLKKEYIPKKVSYNKVVMDIAKKITYQFSSNQ